MVRQCRSCECDLNEFSESKSRIGQCRGCYAHYMREYFKNPLHNKKRNARLKAANHKAKGIIILEPCSLCGASDVEMHHPDYTKPYDVGFLCKTCHTDIHSLELKMFKHGIGN